MTKKNRGVYAPSTARLLKKLHAEHKAGLRPHPLAGWATSWADGLGRRLPDALSGAPPPEVDDEQNGQDQTLLGEVDARGLG